MSINVKPNSPTYPDAAAFARPGAVSCEPKAQIGLTKREWFAGLALQAYLSMFSGPDVGTPTPAEAAESAVCYADALIAALNGEVDS